MPQAWTSPVHGLKLPIHGAGGRWGAPPELLPRAAGCGAGVGATSVALVLGAGTAVGTGVAAGGATSAGGGGTVAGGTALRGGSGGTAVGGEERLTGLRLVVLVQLQLFEEEVGARTHEGVHLGGKHRLDMAKLLVQAAKQIQHLAGLGDGVADIAQAVGELLQLALQEMW